jgi:hypothetical protein
MEGRGLILKKHDLDKPEEPRQIPLGHTHLIFKK